MPNNLTEVREAIIKANPDIMKLEFGCRLLDETHQSFGKADPITCLIADEWTKEEDEKPWIDHFREHSNRYTIAEIRKRFRILGRPIRLSDVLVAIQKVPYCAFLSVHLSDDRRKKSKIELLSRGRQAWWNLLKDDLSLQPEETINFLHSILCKTQ